DVSAMARIVEETHDSTLRNAHALLNLFHLSNRYDDLATHCYGVMSLALMLGQRMDLSDDELSMLGSASLLMDVGWSRLPKQLLKNLVPYTEEEYAQVQTHVDLSVELLESAAVDNQIVDLVAKHHERLDGSGYFSQYRGADVPLMAQIMSLADHYDSLIKGYYDSGPVIPATALKQIYLAGQKGSHSMELVELLIQLVGVYPVSSAVQLDTGEKGLVTQVNWRDALRPKVRIFYSKQGLNLMKPMDVDLYQKDRSDGRKIAKVLDPSDPRQDPQGLLGYSLEG
ncbi:MAG: HD domain-containing protein, partial [Gammaproteobacteria bacterium SHHR-1]